jgi:hypothetical protein
MCQREIARMSLEKFTLEKQLRIQRGLQRQYEATSDIIEATSVPKVDFIPEVDYSMDFAPEVRGALQNFVGIIT